ncbi:chemotaxis protein CheB [Hymenobacter busanensis]|uniref:protein-glutamate methylesterase n=2 Tax=Hymenobacter busanensis TaxID=2607656 RepID=A0A7L5A3M3_9BACT|nr:chemotaxis protein CheB [Hymenobacter busanensis]QHJ09745.1 chemotaxis protein CheB [Hymenobacter busanensis]
MPALTQLVAQLPADLPAAVFVVQHLAPDSSGPHLASRLAQHTSLQCHLAEDGQHIAKGHLYLAPPDRHLLVKEGHVLVTKGPRENHYRPAADALFRSAAAVYGPLTIGVVLTGMLHDGTAGLELIKRAGGVAVVQDPHDAEYPSMPVSALRNVQVDYSAPLSEMGALLQQLCDTRPLATGPVPDDIIQEAAIAERVVGTTQEVRHIGRQVPLTCPDCGGALWEMKHGNLLRYRCHTGHAFTADGLLRDTQESLEETLWVALRMMEERKNLLSSMAMRGEGQWSVQQEERSEELKQHINRLREFLLNGRSASNPLGEVDAEGSSQTG